MLGDYPMQPEDIDYVRKCIDDNCLIRFYTWSKWLKLRAQVLKEDKYECQTCRDRGRYTRATHVHHVNHVRKHPAFALVKVLPNGGRQLISVCQACHELEHPERMRKAEPKRPVTEERWD